MPIDRQYIKESPRSIQSSFVLIGFHLISHSGVCTWPQVGQWTNLTYTLSCRIRRQRAGQRDVQRNRERDGSGGEAEREEQQLHRPLLPVCGGKKRGQSYCSLFFPLTLNWEHTTPPQQVPLFCWCKIIVSEEPRGFCGEDLAYPDHISVPISCFSGLWLVIYLCDCLSCQRGETLCGSEIWLSI